MSARLQGFMPQVLILLSICLLSQPSAYCQKALTGTDIKGAWTCYEIRNDYSSLNEQALFYFNNNIDTQFVYFQWLVTDDSIFEFEYPCTYNNKHSFELKSDSIFYDGHPIAFDHITLKNDSLTLTGRGSSNSPASVHMFARTQLEMSTVELLKKEHLNPQCYSGKMKLQRYSTLKNGTKRSINFPVKMPDYIIITDKEKKRIMDNYMITLIIDGKERTFFCSNAGWYKSNKDPKRKGKLIWEQKTSILLTPSPEWWKGEHFEAVYEQE